MSIQRLKVPAGIKRTLIEEAGGRCINPGCPSARVHLHHISDWATYETHDAKHMIAICPTCHDAVHHGALIIDDETLYRWKTEGKGPRKADLLFVEPGKNPLIKLGRTAITGLGSQGLVVLAPSPNCHLSYTVEDGEIVLVSCKLADSAGTPIIGLADNRIRIIHPSDDFNYARVPGHFQLTGPPRALLDGWMIDGVRTRLPNFGDGPEVVLEAEVVAAGEIAIRGIWRDGDRVLVVRDEGWVIPRSATAAMLMTGSGTIHWKNPIDLGLFETEFKLW